MAVFSVHIIEGTSPFSHHFDMDTQFYLYRGFMKNVFASGKIPLWTPHIYCGMPFLGFSHTSTLYPLTLFYLIGEFANAHLWSSILHLFIYGAFYFLFFRVLGWNRGVAFLMAGVLCFSGYYLRSLDSLPATRSMAWLPAILFALVLLRDKITFLRIFGLAVVTAISVSGGEVELLAHLFLFVTISIIAGAWGAGRRAKGMMAWGLAMAIAVLMAAALLVPLAEFSSFNLRSKGLTYAYFTKGYNLSAIFIVIKSAVWPAGRFLGAFSMNYSGFLVVLLGVAGISRLKRDKDVRLWLALLIYSLLIMSMASTPVGVILYHLPVFNKFHNHVRVLYLFQLSWVLLAGCGLRYLAEKGGKKLFVYIVSISLVHGILWLIFDPRPELWAMVILQAAALGFCFTRPIDKNKKWAYGVLAVILMLDLMPLAWRSLPRNREDIFKPDRQYAEFFSNVEGMYRTVNIGVWPRQNNIIPRQAGFLYNTQSIEGWISLPPYRISRLLGLMDPEAFEFKDGKLDSASMVYKFKEGNFIHPGSMHLLNLFGLKYLSCIKCDLRMSSTTPGSDMPLQRIHSTEFDIYRNSSALERAFIAHSSVSADNLDQALEIAVDGNNFFPRKTVILESNITGSESDISLMEDNVHIVEYHDDAIKLEANIKTGGYMVLTDAYYPGWRAWDNGIEVRILPADVAFRALSLGPGKHEIKMVYEPQSFRIGLWVSIASLLSFCLAVIVRFRIYLPEVGDITDGSKKIT